MAAYLEWLALQGRKDKLKAACLKRLWATKSEKYRRAKNKVFGQMLQYFFWSGNNNSRCNLDRIIISSKLSKASSIFSDWLQLDLLIVFAEDFTEKKEFCVATRALEKAVNQSILVEQFKTILVLSIKVKMGFYLQVTECWKK